MSPPNKKMAILASKLGKSPAKKSCGCTDCSEGKTCDDKEPPATSNPKDALIEEMLGHLLDTDRKGVLKYLDGMKKNGSSK